MAEPDIKRADFDPYFEMWDSVIHFPNPATPIREQQKIFGLTGDGGVTPCYVHRSCGGYVRLGYNGSGKYPVRICPHCGVDTAKEVASKNTNNSKVEIILPAGVSNA